MEVALLGLFLAFLACIPFVLPVIGWVSGRRTSKRVADLEKTVRQQSEEIVKLVSRLRYVEESAAAGPAVAAQQPSPAVATPLVVAPAPPIESFRSPALEPAAAPSATAFEPAQLSVSTPAEPEPAPIPPLATPPPRAPAWRVPSLSFDWESLVGVKLFSAVAGIALVLAAVLFLRYSIDSGWLQPPVRVIIGILVAVTLLVLCELKAARKYPATANALDGAAVAILFATFFAAHSLWNLISASVSFLLLAVVTALAVLLSIRRQSLFIAVLGLLGGFATPAFLSAGEDRPIPLFAYLLLLNIGLAWVAYRQIWPVLTWLTLGLTTLYQWVWVARFLGQSNLPLAMAVFLIFPIAAAGALILMGPRAGDVGEPGRGREFERTALLSAGLPLLFAIYLASAPAYGSHAALLLGFLLLIDAGLLAIALARRMPLLHGVGALGTVVVLAVWLTTSYVPGRGQLTTMGFGAGFVLLHLAAPVVARWAGRPFAGTAVRIGLTAPLLLFVFPVLVVVEPAVARPLPLFTTLLVLLILIAWRAMAERNGALYFVASFFAIATEAIWSGAYLTNERLATAVAIYTAFGVAMIAVPLIARRSHRALQPEWGGGAVLIASLVLLLFVSLGPVSDAGLWALALLLAILNAGLFVESASAGLPLVAQVGSVLSWALLGLWWMRAAASVGILSSLIVMTGLMLITVAGHAWASSQRRSHETEAAPAATSFGQGLYLALIGHVFLIFVAANREWSLPPWPLFGSLIAITLATSAASQITRASSLHGAGAIGAALVVASWAGAAGSPQWGLTVVVAAALASAYALGWIRVAGPPARSGDRVAPDSAVTRDRRAETAAARAAGVVLFVSEIALLNASGAGARAPFPAELPLHLGNIAAILFLTWRYKWRFAAIGAAVMAGVAVTHWLVTPALSSEWQPMVMLASGFYLIFVGYPLLLGARARGDRDPYIAAVIASAVFFVAARHAFSAAGLSWAVGIIPLAEAAVLALLLRTILVIEGAGERDLGRLALVAGAALAFVTVAIPLQLRQQWITIGWALEGAALAWLYRRIPHRGLLYAGSALLATVFVRLALNPEILLYEPRGTLRILNWYLYTYLIGAGAMLAAARWFAGTSDRLIAGLPRASALLPGAAVILLFLLLNIEIADFYATGPTITFRFGAGVSQDLTYTIGWLLFGMLLLAAGIYSSNRTARVAAVGLIAVTTFKCFLYDLASLEGLYRVASFVGLALALALVSLALQKFVLGKPESAS